MKKFASFGWLVLIAALNLSCQSSEAKIKPGDKLGDMEFINNYDDCQAPNLNELCTFDSLFDGSCEIPASITRFWVSSGWMEGSREALELAWKDSKWSMTVDGYTIDLYSFGTYDLDWQVKQNRLWDVYKETSKEIHSDQEKARMWNVCISNPPPGKHTVRYEFYMKNGIWRGNHEETFTFTILAAKTP